MTFSIQRCIPESARWLASRGRDVEAIGYLEKVAKWNRRELPSGEILSPILMACREKEKVHNEENELGLNLWKNFSSIIANYVNLVRTPELRFRSLCIWTLYMSTSFSYYGAVLDSTSFTTDPFLCVFLGYGWEWYSLRHPCLKIYEIMNFEWTILTFRGAMEIPAYTLTQPIVALCGRRPTLLLCFAFTAACNFALAAIPGGESVKQINVKSHLWGSRFNDVFVFW